MVLINMYKSELIKKISQKQLYLSKQDVECAVKTIIECMSRKLENGGCIYVREFGTFSVRKRNDGKKPKNRRVFIT